MRGWYCINLTSIFKVGRQDTQQRKYTIRSNYRWLLRKRRIHEGLVEEMAKNGTLVVGAWQNEGNGEGRSGGRYTTSQGTQVEGAWGAQGSVKVTS